MTSLQSIGQTESQRTSGATVRPAKLLVVVDGSERAGRVIEYALGLVSNGKQREIVLLGVVRQPDDARLRGYGSFKRDQINAHLKDALGRRSMCAAARRFDQAGVVHKDRIEVGDPVETILRVASEEVCDLILVADAPAGTVQRWLPKAIGLSLATVAGQVAQQAVVPVVVVK
jgi:nucleotide-binding universal stress UspA family protein